MFCRNSDRQRLNSVMHYRDNEIKGNSDIAKAFEDFFQSTYAKSSKYCYDYDGVDVDVNCLNFYDLVTIGEITTVDLILWKVSRLLKIQAVLVQMLFQVIL